MPVKAKGINMEFEDKLAYGRNYNVYFFEKKESNLLTSGAEKYAPTLTR